MKTLLYTLSICSFCFLVYAGGNPGQVAFPANYKTEFTQYDTRNRSNGNQVAIMYANKAAMDSVTAETIADGAIVVMEVYKTIAGADGKPVTGADGIFEKGPLAAIAVMEKKSDWPANFVAEERAGNWGFAIYQTDGSPKANDLECASCHQPLTNTDHMFTYTSLKRAAM